jgi:hypothetical protein
LLVELVHQKTVLLLFPYLFQNLTAGLGIRNHSNAYVLLVMRHHSYRFHILDNALLEALLAV